VRISEDVAQVAFDADQIEVESPNGAEGSIDGATLQRGHESRGLRKTDLAKSVAVSDFALGTW
jgi:hypothetical protein